MSIPLPIFVAIATQCAPTVNVDTLAAVAHVETGLDPLKIGDNTSRRHYSLSNRSDAAALATRLIAQGHSVDLGLMQINSRNLAWLGLSVSDAFDACRSMAAGARVLEAGYTASSASQSRQPALLRAISRYNTGNAVRGFANGYVERVRTAARVIVPSIREFAHGSPSTEGKAVAAPPEEPPTWDVYRQARYRALHGAEMLASGERNSEPVPVQVLSPVFNPSSPADDR